MFASIASIAQSVLYEGYVLWPYRRSALKNQRRWTFGGVYPRSYSEAGHDDDPWLMRTECLVETTAHTELDITIRFLHVVERRVARIEQHGPVFVDSLAIGGVSYASWQEAAEREITVPRVRILHAEDGAPMHVPITLHTGVVCERLGESKGPPAGMLVRRWKGISGAIDVSVHRIARGVHKIRVDVANDSPWAGEPREAVLERTLVSTHTVLAARRGAFVSRTDPPPALRAEADECKSIGAWPVLIGVVPHRDLMLSAPIILPDYPEAATESSGDFFDGAEIDQLLVLSVLSMTEDEQRQMRETDPRTRAILDRCHSMSPDDLRRLHGVTREVRSTEVRA
jgi:hypothetical protein